LSYIDSYFLRKKLTFLPLKINGASDKPRKGSGYITVNISGEGISGIDIDFIKVLKPRILTFKRFPDIYY
jgi:hypothetical protein